MADWSGSSRQPDEDQKHSMGTQGRYSKDHSLDMITSRELDQPNMSDLRIVLLGKSVSENSKVGNFILGRAAFGNEAPPDVVERVRGLLKDRNVMIINSPQLLQTNISDDQITQTVKECVNLSDPGPHVFIILVQYDDFTEDDLRRVKHVLKEFSEEAIKRTIVITTDEETDSSFEIINYVIARLIEECGDEHLKFEEGNEEWHSEMFNRVYVKLKGNLEDYLRCQTYEDVKGPSVDEEQSRFEEGNKIRFDINDEVRDLRIVFLGKSVSDNRRLGNIILENAEFDSEAPPDVVERVRGQWKDRQVMIINSPQLLQTNISDDQITQTVRECVNLSAPGPHVFIIIVQYNDFTEDDMRRVKHVLKEFSEEAIKRTIVITTDEEAPFAKLYNLFMSNVVCHLIKECGERHLKLEERKPEWHSDMFNRVDVILKGNLEDFLRCQTYEDVKGPSVDEEQSSPEEEHKIRLDTNDEGAEGEENDQESVWFIEKRGNAKSVTENPVLGRDMFHSHINTDSLLIVCQKGVGEVDGRSVTVIDTQGLFDTSLSNYRVMEEYVKCISMSSTGPHVFVIVLSLGRFNREEVDILDLIEKTYGIKSAQFSIILFNRGEALEGISMQDHMKKSNFPELKKLIRHYGNQENQNRAQEVQLLNMKAVKNTNMGQCFTNNMFEEAEMSINKRIHKILKGIEREIQDVKAVKSTYELAMKDIRSLEEEKQRTYEEKLEMQNQFREKEDKLRKELEDANQKSAEYHQKIEELNSEIKNQRLQYENQQKEEEKRKNEEEYKQDQETLRSGQKKIIALLQKKVEEETIKRDLEEKRRIEEVKKERQRWEKKIKEVENEREVNKEEFTRQQKEWEDEKKKQMRELEERRKKWKQEREIKEREYEEQRDEMKRQYEQLEQERKYEWERRKQEDDERQKEEEQRADKEKLEMQNQFREREDKLRKEFEEKEKTEQKKQEIENHKRSEEEKLQRAEYHQKIEEMKREIENQRSQYEKQQKEKEEENRKMEEEYRQVLEKMRSEQKHIITQFQMKVEQETKKRDLEVKRRIEEVEEERQRLEKKLEEAENEREVNKEEFTRQQKELEDEKKKTDERTRGRRKKTKRETIDRQEELEKMRERFKREREEERKKIEEERQKWKQERKEKAREYEEQRDEMKRQYKQLEQERKEDDERQKEEKQRADDEKNNMQKQLREKEDKLRKEKKEQKKREIENQKRSENDKQKSAEYQQKIEEMKKEIDNQRSQYEKQLKEKEEDDRKKEEKYRQDKEKIKHEQKCIIADLQRKHEEENKKRDSEEKWRTEEEQKERQRWQRKIQEAKNERQAIQEELEKMRERLERVREEERQKIEAERQKQEREREYEEKQTKTEIHYEQLEQERKKEWQRKKQEDDERQKEERKRREKMIEDLKQQQEEDIMRREREIKEKEEREQREMEQKYEEEIKDIKKKHEDKARKQKEEFLELKLKFLQHVLELTEMLRESERQQRLWKQRYHMLLQENERQQRSREQDCVIQ